MHGEHTGAHDPAETYREGGSESGRRLLMADVTYGPGLYVDGACTPCGAFENGLMTHGLVLPRMHTCTYCNASSTDVPVILFVETADLRERVDVAVRVC